MLTEDDLKIWLHTPDLSRCDKLLLVLASLEAPCSISQIREKSMEVGLKIPISWNPSSILSRSEGLAIRTSNGWEIAEKGLVRLQNVGVQLTKPSFTRVARDLHEQLHLIENTDTREFVEEAIKCYESSLFRSAIVMSWLAAVAVLHQLVIPNHLSAFNAALQRRNPKAKPVRNVRDIENLRESDFIDLLGSAAIIGKNTKTELKACLDRRNTCGHPNAFKVGENMVTSHIESLLLNVFEPFDS